MSAKRLLCATLMTAMAVLTAGTGMVSGRAAQDDTYTRDEADFIARRLYVAILGRDADPAGLSQNIAELQRGNLRNQIDGMFRSQEFSASVARKAPSQILEQFYRGLLNRMPDTDGVRGFLPQVQQRRYTDVMVALVQSDEFEARVPGLVNRRRAQQRPPAPPRGDLPREIDFARVTVPCQDAVLERMRAERGGRIVVRFNPADVTSGGRNSDSVRGTGTDLLDGDRRFTYRCEVERGRGFVTDANYSFDSGPWDPGSRIPTVRECQDAVRQQVQRDRGRRDLVFETAGIMPAGRNAETVRGRAREDTTFGQGQAIEYACDVDRGRVTNATFRYVR